MQDDEDVFPAVADAEPLFGFFGRLSYQMVAVCTVTR